MKKKKVIESCFPLLVKDMKEGEVRNILNSSTLNGSQVKGNLFEHGTRAEALIVTDTCIFWEIRALLDLFARLGVVLLAMKISVLLYPPVVLLYHHPSFFFF